VHIARLTSVFHSAFNPIHVIASFRTAGIVSRLAPDSNGLR
jgi:hypothetical protein